MPQNYILLERIELASSAASVVFNNIPQTGYTDLVLKVSSRSTTTSTATGVIVQFNGSSTGYTYRLLEGDGSAAASYTGSTARAGVTGGDPGIFGSLEMYITNYAGSTNKSISTDSVQENNTAQTYIDLNAGLWSNTAAITSIAITLQTGNLDANSTFSLYGIAAVGTTPVIAPKATGGNRIDNDGTYWYHTYTSTGSFTPLTGLSADLLVIAGGGGGGASNGAGGGAGGLLSFTNQTLTPINYSIIVGGGGTQGNTSIGGPGGQGNNSSFGALTASVGGGFGAGGSTTRGGNGGSGGGGKGNDSGGSATSGQGFAGGNAPATEGNGGGGAGEVGGTDGNGRGGDGVSTFSAYGLATSTGQNISGTVWYAGGGAGSYSGSNGGDGGGGNPETVGAANTGGGGGAWAGGANPFTGGSGVVIVRYPIA